MKPHEHFLHLFTPRHTNNHRAKILHIKGLAFCIAFLLVFQISLSFVHIVAPQVLGYATNINISDLFFETNSKRTSAGVSPLTLNDQLTNAASGKGNDMFQNQYWAHVSPQGKEPWAFITGAGYNYVFAGENLARDFGDSKAVVDAWMDSPSHRENLLNERFHDVGFAIVNGKYGGAETTVVVQMFGSKSQSDQIEPESAALTPAPTASPSPVPIANIKTTPPIGKVLPTESQVSQPKFDILSLTRGMAMGLTILLLSVLAIDAFLVYRRKIIRLSGHNVSHILILIMVLAAITLLGRGVII